MILNIHTSDKKSLIDSKILSLFQELGDAKNIQIFLHGSRADNTANSFSDIDDFVIIDDFEIKTAELAKIESKLKKIENEFIKIDPLQHHGHWKIYKSQLLDYNNSFIPLYILKDAICIKGNPVISAQVNVVSTYSGLKNQIKNACQSIDKNFQKYLNKTLNIYDAKHLISAISLVPALLFQLKEINITKKEAIYRAEELFLNNSIEILKWATDIRSKWDEIINKKVYINFVENAKDYDLISWNKHCSECAPVIDFSEKSTLKPNNHLINEFLKRCKEIIDECSIPNVSHDDYNKALGKVIEFAKKNNASFIGKYGQIKHPGVSDLDIIVCFPDNVFKKAKDEISRFIEHDFDMYKYIIHDLLYISDSMLEYLPYLHTITNLDILYSKHPVIIKDNTSTIYKHKQNILWALFIIHLAQETIIQIEYIPIRDILHRIKNIHSSIERLSGKSGYYDIKTNYLRKIAVTNTKEARSLCETELKESLNDLLLLINLNSDDKKKHQVINRRLLLKTGKFNIQNINKKTIIEIPTHYYEIFEEYYQRKSKDNEISAYLKAYKTVDSLFNEFGTENKIINLFHHYPIYNIQSNLKQLTFRIISMLPLNILMRII